MLNTILMAITAFSAVSREIREWIALRKREKDDESHPPLSHTQFSPIWDNILYLTEQYIIQS